MTDARDAVDDLLALGRWHLEAIRRHLGDVNRLTAPLLKGPTEGCTFEEARLGERLTEAIHASTLQLIGLYHELRVWQNRLTPDQLAELSVQEAEYERLAAEWRGRMEAAYHLHTLGKLPQ
jgi:hypothetical protein